MNEMMIPMRPTATGVKPTVARVRELRECGWIVQRKLNGDRVILDCRGDGMPVAWNRYGTEYGHKVATTKWQGCGYLLDGEVIGGEFIPFDIVDYDMPLVARTSLVNALCDRLGVEWIWEADDQYIRDGAANGTRWEGVVAKVATSKYRPLGKPHQESAEWVKLKW
jgi:hypothetical protein